MKDTKDILEEHGQRRRSFMTKSAKMAVAAPAVTLLLSQATMPVYALSGNEPTNPVTTT